MTAQNAPFKTAVKPYGKAAVDEAARLILEGLPVAIPTETVYGLAADATNPDAVARIFEAKGRPGYNPLIIHVADLTQAEAIADLPNSAHALASAYWPGPLTLVVPQRERSGIAPAATAGLPTVALRSPAHPAMRDLLAGCGRPLAAPSANASGGISPTSADHVLSTLRGRIPLIIDGGPTEHGIESTILGFNEGRLALLRPGPLDFAELASAAQMLGGVSRGGIEAPGQLASHYAPAKPLRLNAAQPEPGEWMIGFGSSAGDDNLSSEGSLVEAASRLFGALHRADAQARPRIAVAPIPEVGVGIAINDRLRRASAPRHQG